MLGEVHTTFTCRAENLYFSALVINKMSIPILASTNFHIENGISTRMATNSICIGNTHTVQSTSPSILSMDQSDTRIRLSNIQNKLSPIPGEPINLSVPPRLSSNCETIVEPSLAQSHSLFTPHISQVCNSPSSNI